MAQDSILEKRLKKTLAYLEKSRLDALLVSCPTNIFYLTGLRHIEGYLLIGHKRLVLFTDFRYQLKCKERCRHLGIALTIYGFGIFDFIASRIKKLKVKKVGCEAKILSHKEYLEFKKSFQKQDLQLVSTYDVIKSLRKIKDRQELRLIKKSVEIAGQTFAFLQDIIYEGLTEKFVVNEAVHFLKAKADLELAFPPIVASGSLSAQPHPSPREVKIAPDMPILIDLGARYRGYCSDLTRLLFLSKMPNYIKKLIDIIKAAQAKSIGKIREGVKAKVIDRTARAYIAKKGYAKFFGHSLGHGVGLEVHELPSLNAENEEILKEGMVVTIEPGIYLPGRFGIRQESMVAVKSRGAEILDK